MSTLSQKIGDLTFNSPIMVASGPMSDSVELIRRAEEMGAGAVSVKLTLFHQPVKGRRRMYGVRGMYNFNSTDKRNDLEDGLRLVESARKAVKLPLFANIAGKNDDLDTWISIGRSMENAGADVLELNFCCPNMVFSTDAKTGMKVGTHLGRSPETMAKIVAAMKGALKTPIWVKATGTNLDYTISAKTVVAAGADGLITNGAQLVVPPIDIYNGGRTCMPTMANNSLGALVGPVNRMHSNRLICTASRECDVPIAGGGGISQWEHVVETIMFGASMTQICTKFLWDGFGDIPKMNQQLLAFMEKQGYGTIADMRGIARKHLVMGDKLEFIDSAPVIDNEKCVGCGACAKIGSCTALRMDGKKVLFDAEKCVSCGLCGSLCPAKAISFA